MAKIRVLVVEDSLTVRKHLVEFLASDPEIEVVGEAGDGKEAFDLCRNLRPDIVTLDMMLPEVTGVEATEHIMAYCPTPILIVSASTNRAELFRTYDALAAGALDVMEKPLGDEFDDAWKARFAAAVKLVSRIRVITHPRAKLHPRQKPMPTGAAAPGPLRCMAMGASTGGPGALAEILKTLPPEFPFPILLVIHIGQPFGTALSEWLDGLSPLRVTQAVDGQPLPPVGKGAVFLAPPDRHLVLRESRLWLTAEAERHSCRPSIDILFESVAAELGPRAVGCLLTGMGRDGAAGLLAIRRRGGLTIAQDEGTSVIFGMPREAILLNAAARVLPLEEIGPALAELGGRHVEA